MTSRKDQERINDFFRKYVDRSFNNPKNCIRISKANTREHNDAVYQACRTLLENDIPFWTEVKLTCGLRPDIVCPTHVKQCIEILHTEDVKKFKEKKIIKIPGALIKEYLLVFTNEDVEKAVL